MRALFAETVVSARGRTRIFFSRILLVAAIAVKRTFLGGGYAETSSDGGWTGVDASAEGKGECEEKESETVKALSHSAAR